MATTASTVFGGQCLSVAVKVVDNSWNIDTLWLGLGFLFGLIFGLIISILIVFACLKDNALRRRNDEEEARLFGDESTNTKSNGKIGDTSIQLLAAQKLKKKRGKKKLLLRKKKKSEDEDDHVDIAWPDLGEGDKKGEGDVEEVQHTGLVEAATQNTSEGLEAEISRQDFEGIVALETEQREEWILALIQVVRLLLFKLVNKGKITAEFAKEKTKEFQENINNAIRAAQAEKEEKEEELRKNDKLKKDPNALELELDKLYPAFVQKLSFLMKEEKEKLKHDLNSKTELTDDEIEKLMGDLAENMAKLDRKLAVDRARHAATLEDKLARRRQLARTHQLQHDQVTKEAEYRTDEHEKMMGQLVTDGKLLDRQKDDLLREFDDNMRELTLKQNEEKQKQELRLMEKLRKNRENRNKKIEVEHERQREEFLKTTSRGSQTASSFVDSLHALLQQQRDEREDISIETDTIEAQELKKLRQQMEQETYHEMENKDVELKQKVFKMGQISQKDVDKLLRIHSQQMDQLQGMRAGEKKRMQAILQEKLAQKRAQQETDQAALIAEQQALDEQQDNMLKKVLTTQMELPEEAKERILREHDQNMQTVHNQLQMSKLRQNKQLEQKLAARRAKLADMKKEAEQAKEAKKHAKPKEKEKLEKQLSKQIEEEENKLEEDRKRQIAAQRQRLAEETAALLAEQEKQMGLLIAGLQVGAARRQAIITKQDKTIKELEEQLANRVAEGGVAPPNKVDQLLQHHQHQTEQLEDQLHASKERHENVLIEKLQAKRLKKERDLEHQLEAEAQQEWHDNKMRGAGLATSLLSQSMLEQRHRNAMQQLEKEMHVEMQKQREELDRELDEELQKEVQDQKKAFLAQLAAVARMSSDEVNEIVDHAVADSGGNETQAKKLAKELRLGMKRAKTDLQMDNRDRDRGYDNAGYRRERTDVDDRYNRPASGRRDDYDNRYDDRYDEDNYRPKSAKRNRPKSAFKHDQDYYEDNRYQSVA